MGIFCTVVFIQVISKTLQYKYYSSHFLTPKVIAVQSAGAEDFIDCISAEG